MKRSTRNRLFEEKQPLIDQVMNRRRSLIEGYGLCKEDVRQELALEMLRALDVYDPARCPNLDAYLVQRMNYKLLQMLSPGKRYGIPNAPKKKGFRVDSLEAAGFAKAVSVKVRKRKKSFQAIRRRLRCWLARKEAVPCAKAV